MSETEFPDFTKYRDKEFYDTVDLEDDKTRTRFIKDIERIIRTSLEYRNFIKYLKTDAMLNYCTIMNKLPSEIQNSIKIEFHHHPITLYDIVDTKIKKYFDNNKEGELKVTRLIIANEVMLEHYLGLIGLIPLTISMHQLAHAGQNILKPKDVVGNYTEWIKQNALHIDHHILKRVEEFINLPEEVVVENIKEYFKLDSSLFMALEDKSEEENDDECPF